MRYLVDVDKPSLEELELAHVGVKGMKWGVRKAYVTRLSKGAASLDKVASGKASAGRKGLVAYNSSAKDLIRGRGVSGAAALQRDRLQQHIDRVSEGRSTAKDVIIMFGAVSMSDIVKGLARPPKSER